MIERYQYRTPKGTLIVGSYDKLIARANISSFDEDGNPDWEGYTEVFWDSQENIKRDDKEVYLDENGDEWTLEQCTLVAEEDLDNAA